MQCSNCGAKLPPGFKFCGQCGRPLHQEATETSPEVRPERRQLTVMFCDLVDSTAVAERLDPEDLRELLQAYHRLSKRVVQRFEGYIAQYLGDGILAYFGYPVAHEDDPQRALHAALGILAETRRLSRRRQRQSGFPVSVRIGIHTGRVVAGEVGEGEARERLALGETPNVAARMQSLARPDTAVVSAATHRLAEGFFLFEPLGAKEIKGLSRPVEVFRLLRASAARDRFEHAGRRGLTPFVGRSRERSTLLGRFQRAAGGEGQVVLLSGEAGIGKSRLVADLKESAREEACTWVVGPCSPFYRDSALYPLAELLQELLDFLPEDGRPERAAKLEETLRRLELPLPEAIPLFSSLLGLPLGEGYRPLTFTPQRQRERTLELSLDLLIAAARERPAVIVMEDLQWVDPSTLEFLDLLIHRVPAAAILEILTFRPTFHPSWKAGPSLTPIHLDRLRGEQVEAVAGRVTGGKALPAEVLREVVDKSDGIPLVIEELVKMILEVGLLEETEDGYRLTKPLSEMAIPATLQDSLTARLDRLEGAKEVAQVASVLGREFSADLLRVVAGLDEFGLRKQLKKLVDAEMIYRTTSTPQPLFTFKHALIQDTAYRSLLKDTRRGLHRKTAEALRESSPEVGESRPEILAHHYTGAGLPEPAIRFWLKAGRRAFRGSANRESIGHLTKGLNLIEELPDGVERHRLELSLQTALGPSLIALEGFAESGVETTYARARELCERLGRGSELFWILRGLWAFYVVRAELEKSLEFGFRLLRLAESQGDEALLFEAQSAVALPLFFLGRPAEALEHFDRGIAYESPGRDRSAALKTGLDVAVTSLAMSGVVAWQLGFPDRALDRSRRALDLADEISHPFSLADALYSAAFLHELRRDRDALEKTARRLLTLAEEQGFHLQAHGNVLLGWALVDSGDATVAEEGLARIERGVASYRGGGAVAGLAYFQSKKVEALSRLGRHEESRETLARTAEMVAAIGDDYFWLPEIRRLEASQAETAEDPGAAETRYLIAIEIAARQGSRSLELRAAISLARLWHRRGETDRARELLAPLYDSFDEGFATRDLIDARRLLAALE